VNDVPPPPGSPPGPPSWNPPGGDGPPGGAGGGIGVGDALSYGWAKFGANVGAMLAVILIPEAVQIVLSIIGRGVGTAGSILFSLISLLVSLALSIGVFNMSLMIVRGERADIGRAFSTDRWGEWILFAFVYGLLVIAGLIVCFVGVFFVIAFFGLAPYFFLDQGLSLGDAISRSLQTTRSTENLPVALGLVALVGVAGVILCFVGVLVTMPMAYLGGAYLYRRATNQPVAA
jgi:hypothetical protein